MNPTSDSEAGVTPRLASSTAPQLSFVVTKHNTGAYCYHRTLQMTLCAEAPKQDAIPVLVPNRIRQGIQIIGYRSRSFVFARSVLEVRSENENAMRTSENQVDST